MKYSEELALRLKGVKSDEIAAMKEQEAREAAEEAAKAEAAAEQKKEEEASALELAQTMIKDLEATLEEKNAEVKKLNEDIISLNNASTQHEESHSYDASDVMMELFNNKKED